MTSNPLRKRVGLVVDGTDHFLRPIELMLRERHQVSRFAPRFIKAPVIGASVNKLLFELQFRHFLASQDAVFFEWAGSLLVRASHLPKQARIVARLHSVELATSVEQVDWSQVDHLIVLNQTILHRLRDLVAQPLPPVTIVANGVDLARFRPQPRPFQHRLGMVCSLLPIKRIYEVILCLYQVRQDGRPFTLHIAGAPGDGDARRYAWALQRLVEKLHLQDAVTFCDHVQDVAGWLPTIDIFISNSYWEGQQVALMEAMASRSYCLSHCWDGVEEMLPAENIFTTDGDLRAKLLAYAQLDETAKAQEQARLRAIAEERFDERRMVNQIVDVIETLGA